MKLDLQKIVLNVSRECYTEEVTAEPTENYAYLRHKQLVSYQNKCIGSLTSNTLITNNEALLNVPYTVDSPQDFPALQNVLEMEGEPREFYYATLSLDTSVESVRSATLHPLFVMLDGEPVCIGGITFFHSMLPKIVEKTTLVSAGLESVDNLVKKFGTKALETAGSPFGKVQKILGIAKVASYSKRAPMYVGKHFVGYE